MLLCSPPQRFWRSRGCKQAAAPSESTTPSQPATAAAPQQIGGQDIVKLERKPTGNGQKPEFLSATVLPGRGMNVFQITANIPGKGEVEVFASPSLADAAAKLNGGPDDQNGNAAFQLRRSFPRPVSQSHSRQVLGRWEDHYDGVEGQDDHPARELEREESGR